MRRIGRAPAAVLAGAALLAAAAPAAPSAGDEEPPAPPQATAPPAPAADAAAPARSAEEAPADEEIVVTATRSPRPLRDVPAAVTVLPRSEIERSPTKTLDELLRIVPSFGLFRRTSSVVSDPTAQGVNLRGIGPSGVSRSLVLVDGVPANDPFGGWIYWRGIPRIGIQSVEVVPGGGSALYGNYALGGVMQVFSRPIADRSAEAHSEFGSFGTYALGARATDRWRLVGAAVETELFKSPGYPVVAAPGPIDSDTPSEHANVSARVEARASDDLTFTLRGGYFYEDQNGGTQFTNAQVRQLAYAASARYAANGSGTFDLTLFGHRDVFDQDRARVTPDRSAEALAGSQHVPAHDLGAALLWTGGPLALGGRHTVSLGADVRRISADTGEDLFPAVVTPASVVRRDARGEQWLYGASAQEVYDPWDAISATLAVRFDRWDNTGASRVERLADGSANPTAFPDRSDGQVSPKLGLRLRPIDWLTVRLGAYQAFRAPTLNELYRPFQVGAAFTQANENLRPETLKGAEAGVELASPHGLTVRATAFWNVLDDPITNVTIGPDLRRRENLGQARIRGVEAEAAWRVARSWFATAAYTLVDSRVTEAPGQPQLVGRELPQDPRHRASLSLAFEDPRLFTAAMQVRYVGRQFEDDLNLLPMEGYAVVDLSASRRLAANVDLMLAVENLFDAEYLVGRPGGLDMLGQPRFIHGGVRFHLGG